MNQTTLIVHHREHVSLSEVLSALVKIAAGDAAIALLYSPHSCEFATLVSGELRGSDGRPVDLLPVFEARVFRQDVELRWLNDPGHAQRHRAVILAEQDRSASLGESWNKRSIPITSTLDQTYLLWGEGAAYRDRKSRPLAQGWSLLGTPRIGGLAVPVPGVTRPDQRVLLKTIEYLVEADYGNVVVQDERLYTLEVENG
jgi:CRISPR-associated protein (TIGR03984 family)